MVGMKRLGHLFTVLAFAFTLLMSAAGGAMLHVQTPAGPTDHRAPHHAPSSQAPSRSDHHKAAVAVATICCPAAETPVRNTIAIARTPAGTAWHPWPAPVPGVRDITPDPPPPKTGP